MIKFYDKYEFFTLSILNSPIEISKVEIESIVEDWWGDKKAYQDKLDLDKINPPPIIKPGGGHFVKFVLWEPIDNKNKTALFVNLQDAYDSLIYVWNDRFKKQAITLRLSNDDICEYPHHEFVIRTESNGERIVYTHVESKWEFFQSGNSLDFENLENYKRRKIRDRLTNEIINEYMDKLGYKIWKDDFYKSDKKAIYFEQLAWRK